MGTAPGRRTSRRLSATGVTGSSTAAVGFDPAEPLAGRSRLAADAQHGPAAVQQPLGHGQCAHTAGHLLSGGLLSGAPPLS